MILSSMPSRPQSWVRDYQDVDFEPKFHDSHSSSGRDSPNEMQRMLEDDVAQPMRPAYDVESLPVASTSRASFPRSNLASQVIPRNSNSQDSPKELPKGTLEPRFSSTSSRASSYKNVLSSPLNPASRSGSPPSPVVSPFARAGSRGSAHVTRIPSEESRALSLGSSPLSAIGQTTPRASMILYRRAETLDNALLPPSLPYTRRNSTLSTSGDSIVSLSSDSKYPTGSMMSERGLVAYPYDPSMDDHDVVDDDDMLHDPEGGLVKVAGRPTSWRGFRNLAALVLVVVGLLILFIFYPMFAFFHDDGRNSKIVGNTRINSTGQAIPVDFDPRSQIPVLQLSGVIDPATPLEVLRRTSKDGVLYNLVFSDEFNTDGRAFSNGDDMVWEAAESDTELHKPSSITTRDGYLLLLAANALRWRSSFCFENGYLEVSVVNPGSSPSRRYVWAGTWSQLDGDVPDVSGSSDESDLVQALPLRFSLQAPAAIDYARFYQKAGALTRTLCGETTSTETVDFVAPVTT